MSDKKKISTLEADKQRLLDALKELQKDGVTLIDDRVGRPAVIKAKPRVEVKPPEAPETAADTTEGLILENLDRMSIEEPELSNDPYNKTIK